MSGHSQLPTTVILGDSLHRWQYCIFLTLRLLPAGYSEALEDPMGIDPQVGDPFWWIYEHQFLDGRLRYEDRPEHIIDWRHWPVRFVLINSRGEEANLADVSLGWERSIPFSLKLADSVRGLRAYYVAFRRQNQINRVEAMLMGGPRIWETVLSSR